jgi:Flp pilus assembly pilin Flp
MKIAVKRFIRDEKGAALVTALILLLIGGLITAPLLSYMGTGLLAGEVYETRTAELYAADASVEDAIWRIQEEELAICPGNPSYNYTIPNINGKNVSITVTSISSYEGAPDLTAVYRIESTAMGDDSGTGIEAYIQGVNKYGDYGDIAGNVLTSIGEITLQPGSNVTPMEGEHSPVEYYGSAWPEVWELEDFYSEQVEDAEPYLFDIMNLAGVDMEIGPFYRDGELDIVNTSNTHATLTLEGTVYISGDTEIGVTQKDFTLDMNGQTIFVASNTSGSHKALEIGGKCTIEGPGVILAIGDVYFAPNIAAGMTEPLFIMSVTGDTLTQPNGDFYGAIAGNVEVQLQPGSTINYPGEEGWYDEYNFLIGVQKLIFSIISWEISQQ